MLYNCDQNEKILLTIGRECRFLIFISEILIWYILKKEKKKTTTKTHAQHASNGNGTSLFNHSAVFLLKVELF